MPFFFHPDIKTTNFKVSFLSQGVFDIYKFLDKNRKDFSIPEDFNYFPLTYFFLGGYQFIASPLLGNEFNNWFSNASSNSDLQTGVYRYLFILKVPYLILDIALGFLLMKFFKDKNDKKRVFVLWLFNPISIFLIYIYANFDIIPVFLSVLSLYFALKNKLILAGLILGIAACFKAYPLILLPLLLIYSKRIKQFILTLFSTLGIFFLIIAPFISKPFQESALVSGLTTRIVHPGLGIGFGETIMASVISLSTIFFIALYKKAQNQPINLLNFFLCLMLILLAFIHFHIQWILWVLPFIVILSIKKPKLALPLFILASLGFTIPLFYDDKFMTVSLLSIINPSLSLLPSPFGVFQKIYDPYIVMSTLHSAFIGGVLVTSFIIFKQDE